MTIAHAVFGLDCVRCNFLKAAPDSLLISFIEKRGSRSIAPKLIGELPKYMMSVLQVGLVSQQGIVRASAFELPPKNITS